MKPEKLFREWRIKALMSGVKKTSVVLDDTDVRSLLAILQKNGQPTDTEEAPSKIGRSQPSLMVREFLLGAHALANQS